jgi:putative tRNA adenosine deaminase-associated protein
MSEQSEGVDFALAAYREEGVWTVQELAHELLEDVETMSAALRRFPGDFGALGLVSVDEAFFVLARVAGASTRLLLSDVTAAEEWELAASVLDHLGLPEPEGEDDDAEPAGDLGLLADLGFSAMDLGILLDDDEAYPDEILAEIASKLGFRRLYDDATGVASA